MMHAGVIWLVDDMTKKIEHLTRGVTRFVGDLVQSFGRGPLEPPSN